MNNHLRQQAIDQIKDPNATESEKLNTLLSLVLDNSDAVAKANDGNPLLQVPVAWRKRTLWLFGGWMGWVSVNLLAGVQLSVGDIWKFMSNLL